MRTFQIDESERRKILLNNFSVPTLFTVLTIGSYYLVSSDDSKGFSITIILSSFAVISFISVLWLAISYSFYKEKIIIDEKSITIEGRKERSGKWNELVDYGLPSVLFFKDKTRIDISDSYSFKKEVVTACYYYSNQHEIVEPLLKYYKIDLGHENNSESTE